MDDTLAASDRRTAPAVHLTLLGPLRLEVAGADRTPPGPLLRVLLAVLGTARGEPVPAARLAEALAQAGVEGTPPGGLPRPGPADADPADAVPVQVSRLRDLLGPAAGVVVHTVFGYQLAGTHLRTDLDAVEASVRASRAATAAGNHTAAARALRRALDAWTGPVAADLPAVTALAAIRAHYQRLRRDLVEDLAEARLREGTPAALARCVGDLQEHLREHPSRTRAWAQLVVALHSSGRPAEALEAHRRSRAALAAVLERGAPADPAPAPQGPASRDAGTLVVPGAAAWDQDPVLRRLERAATGADGPLPGPEPEEYATAHPPVLVWLDGQGRSRVHSLPWTGSVLIGRQAAADVRVDGESVSRAHAAVLRVEGGWTLLDLGSRNGTTLNGRPVSDGTPLRAGDVVRCGTVVLLVSSPTAVVDLGGRTALAVPAGSYGHGPLGAAAGAVAVP